MEKTRMILGVFVATTVWLSSVAAAPSVDLSVLPSQIRSLVFIDLSATADAASLKLLQGQLVKASGLEEELEQFLFLSGMDLLIEAKQVALCKVSSKSEKVIPVGLIAGSFSERTRRAIKLSQELLAGRDYRVFSIREDEVVFGAAEAVNLFRSAGEKLSQEAVGEIRTLHSKAPVFGWMGKGWLDAIPEDFSLGPNPTWSMLWARDQVVEQNFTLRGSSAVEFNFGLKVSDPVAAEVLQDELRNYFWLLTRRGDKPELEEALANTAFKCQDGQFSLTLDFSERALEQFGGEDGFTAILNWQNRVGHREGLQKVGEILEAAEVKAGDQVADVGAGRGFLSIRLARLVGEAGRVWAVDIDSEPLERVRKRADDAPYPQLKAVAGEVDDPKLPQGRLDAVFIINAYHEMEEYPAMLEHFRQALKPQGRLVISEPWSKESNYKPRNEQVKDHVISPDLVESELRKAGFEIRYRKDKFLDVYDEGLIVAIRP